MKPVVDFLVARGVPVGDIVKVSTPHLLAPLQTTLMPSQIALSKPRTLCHEVDSYKIAYGSDA